MMKFLSTTVLLFSLTSATLTHAKKPPVVEKSYDKLDKLTEEDVSELKKQFARESFYKQIKRMKEPADGDVKFSTISKHEKKVKWKQFKAEGKKYVGQNVVWVGFIDSMNRAIDESKIGMMNKMEYHMAKGNLTIEKAKAKPSPEKIRAFEKKLEGFPGNGTQEITIFAVGGKEWERVIFEIPNADAAKFKRGDAISVKGKISEVNGVGTMSVTLDADSISAVDVTKTKTKLKKKR